MFLVIFTRQHLAHHQALWLSGYSDRLEIYFLRERRFESCRRRLLFALFDCLKLLFSMVYVQKEEWDRLGKKWVNGGRIGCAEA